MIDGVKGGLAMEDEEEVKKYRFERGNNHRNAHRSSRLSCSFHENTEFHYIFAISCFHNSLN